jgi:transposase-like protein
MVRSSLSDTPEGKRWLARLGRAQRAVDHAEQRRDEVVREALAHNVGVRAVADVLGIDKATVSRRYMQGGSR